MLRSILHCDMNNFYASVECMLDPALKKYPIAVCGSVEERHGIVLAKNYKAKAFDVKTGDAVWQAKQKCKDLVVVPPHYEKVNGERPGKKYGKTLSPLTVAKVLGIPRSTANDLMNDGIVEFIWVDGKRRIKRESFDKWYASQSKYTKVKEIEEVEGYVD